MAQRIKPDVLKALEDWKAGKPVQSLELGHVHRMKDNGSHSPTIDMSVRLVNDQERIHDYLFTLLRFWEMHGELPTSHEEFMARCDETEKLYRNLHTDWEKELTAEEMDAAESLAWKALQVGWTRAIAGHDASQYIEITRPRVESAT
jgi:hypothetical protein